MAWAVFNQLIRLSVKSIKDSTQTDGFLCLYVFSLNRDSDFVRSKVKCSALQRRNSFD